VTWYDFAHARHVLQPELDVPVLQRALLAQIQAGRLEGVPEHVAHARAVGPQGGRDARRQQALGIVKALQHPLAGPIDVGVVLENQEHEAHAEHGGAAHGLDLGQALHVGHQRVGDLVLHDLGAAAHPLGEDDDLVFGQVGNGVDFAFAHRVRAPGEQAGGEQQHEVAVP
jgi:hypothetical protein